VIWILLEVHIDPCKIILLIPRALVVAKPSMKAEEHNLRIVLQHLLSHSSVQIPKGGNIFLLDVAWWIIKIQFIFVV
jgi:hypothetical protein